MVTRASESDTVAASATTARQRRLAVLSISERNTTLVESDADFAEFDITVLRSADDVRALVADSRPVSLAIVDVKSITSSARQLCRLLQKSGIPILLLSSHVTEAFASQLRRTDGLTYRQKPIRRTELRRLVELLTLG